MIITDKEKLSKVSSEVTNREEIPQSILDEMDMELSNPDTIGISAPQLGYFKRVIAFKKNDRKIFLINPYITNKRGVFNSVEGCLSVPEGLYLIKRPLSCIINGIDLNGVELRIRCEEVMSACVCHECLSSKTIISTPNGGIPISKIKVGDQVYGYEGTIVPTTVLGISSRCNTKPKKKWVRVKSSYTSPYKSLTCTEDHPCAILDDILYPSSVSFIQAKDTVGKYIIREPSTKKFRHENLLYNSDQMDVIIGGLMGDSCVGESGEVVIDHGENQREYARYKADILNARVCSGYSGYRNDMSIVSVHCYITAQTKLLRGIRPSKSESVNLINYINDKSLAIWYMDDGNRQKNMCKIHTESSNKSDVSIMVGYLYRKFGIKSSIKGREVNGNSVFYISINTENSIKLYKIISKYIPQCMEYKIPPEFRGGIKYLFSNTPIRISAKKVTKVDYIFHESKLWDLSTGTGNLFANNHLVHNCEHLDGKLVSRGKLVSIKETKKENLAYA